MEFTESEERRVKSEEWWVKNEEWRIQWLWLLAVFFINLYDSSLFVLHSSLVNVQHSLSPCKLFCPYILWLEKRRFLIVKRRFLIVKRRFLIGKTPFFDWGKTWFYDLYLRVSQVDCWWSRLQGTPWTTVYLNWRKLNNLNKKKFQNICHCHRLLATYWLSAIYFFVMVTDDLETGLRPHKNSVFWCRWQQKSSVTHLSPW